MIGREAAGDLYEETWLRESHHLAVRFAYDPEVLTHLRIHEREGTDPGRLDLSERYLKAGGAATRHQIVKAGFRLGAVLREVVGDQQGSASGSEANAKEER